MDEEIEDLKERIKELVEEVEKQKEIIDDYERWVMNCPY
jgi:DNA-binding transcriptional regulator GbsR (MarR family)